MHHGVRISDSSIVEAVVLSNRYITDRQLPDKAIDLIDEAAAMIRTEIDSLPTELDEANRKVMQLEIEREALRKETDDASRERLEKLENELRNLQMTQGRASRASGKTRRASSTLCAISRARSSRRASPLMMRPPRRFAGGVRTQVCEAA